MPYISQSIIEKGKLTTATAPSVTAAAATAKVNTAFQLFDPEPKESRLAQFQKSNYFTPAIIVLIAVVIIFFIYKKMK